MRKIHILVIPSWYAHTQGIISGIYFKEQFQALKKYGHQIGIVAPVYHDFPTFLQSVRKFKWPNHPLFKLTSSIEQDIPIYRWHCLNMLTFRLPLMRRFNIYLYKKKVMTAIDNYIKTHGVPDLIHAHCVFWGGYAAMHVSKKYQIPLIITEHSSNYGRRKIHAWRIPFLYAILQHTARFLTVSDSLGKNIQNTGEINYEVVPNVVDTQFFMVNPKPPLLSIIRFVTIAELKTCKGLHLLIEAFALAFKGREDILLEIGGEGPQENNLKRLVSQLGIENQIKFHGVLSRERVRETLYNAHAFILPSYYETFGVVIIEAMATGLPVIGTSSGGPIEIIINDKLGLLVKPDSIVDLRDALHKMLANILSGKYDAEYIRNYVINNYSQEIVVNKLNEIYTQVLANSERQDIVTI